MIAKLREIKRTLDTSIRVEERAETDFKSAIITSIVLMAVGVVIVTINAIQGAYNIAIYPAVIFVWGCVNLVIVLKLKSRRGVMLFTVPVIMMSMTAMVLLSDNGFAYLWTMLIPICFCYLFSVKIGIIATVYFQIFLIVLFYTPARKLVEGNYPEIAIGNLESMVPDEEDKEFYDWTSMEEALGAEATLDQAIRTLGKTGIR